MWANYGTAGQATHGQKKKCGAWDLPAA
jgi:hypothetical protein